LSLADERGINVTAADVRKAADLREYFAKLVGPLPRDSERADATAAHAADRAQIGIAGEFNVVRLRDVGNQFVDEETRVSVAKRVVFETAVAAICRASAGLTIRAAISRIDEE